MFFTAQPEADLITHEVAHPNGYTAGYFTYPEAGQLFEAAPPALSWCMEEIEKLRDHRDKWEQAYNEVVIENDQLRARPSLTPAPAMNAEDAPIQLYLAKMDGIYAKIRALCSAPTPADGQDSGLRGLYRQIDLVAEAMDRYKYAMAEVARLRKSASGNIGETSPK